MSPEQALGKDVDLRSDLFSRVVLYEAATGALPFPGETTAAIFDGILNHLPPPPSELNHSLPPQLDRIITTCLKDRAIGYQSAADVGADLKRLKRDTDSDKVAAVARVAWRRHRRPVAGIVTAMSVVLFLVTWLRYVVWTPRGTESSGDNRTHPRRLRQG